MSIFSVDTSTRRKRKQEPGRRSTTPLSELGKALFKPHHRRRGVSTSSSTGSQPTPHNALPCSTQSVAQTYPRQTPTAGTLDIEPEKPPPQSPTLSTNPTDMTLDVDASRPEESETDNSPERTIHTFLQRVFYPSASEEQRPGRLSLEEVEDWNHCASVLSFVARSSLLVESKSGEFGDAGTKLLEKLGRLRNRTLSWVYPMFQREDEDEHGKHLDGRKQCFDIYDKWKRQWSETNAYDHQAIYSSLQKTWSNCMPMLKESPNGGWTHWEGYEFRNEARSLFDDLRDLMEPRTQTKEPMALRPCSRGSCYRKKCPKVLCLYDINPWSEQAGRMDDSPTQTATEPGNSSQNDDMTSGPRRADVYSHDETGNKSRDHGVPSDTQISKGNPDDDENRDNGNQSNFVPDGSIECASEKHTPAAQTTGDDCTGGPSSKADGRSMALSQNQEESNGQDNTTAKSSRFRTWGTLAAVGAAAALSAYLLKGRKGWDRFR